MALPLGPIAMGMSNERVTDDLRLTALRLRPGARALKIPFCRVSHTETPARPLHSCSGQATVCIGAARLRHSLVRVFGGSSHPCSDSAATVHAHHVLAHRCRRLEARNGQLRPQSCPRCRAFLAIRPGLLRSIRGCVRASLGLPGRGSDGPRRAALHALDRGTRSRRGRLKRRWLGPVA